MCLELRRFYARIADSLEGVHGIGAPATDWATRALRVAQAVNPPDDIITMVDVIMRCAIDAQRYDEGAGAADDDAHERNLRSYELTIAAGTLYQAACAVRVLEAALLGAQAFETGLAGELGRAHAALGRVRACLERLRTAVADGHAQLTTGDAMVGAMSATVL